MNINELEYKITIGDTPELRNIISKLLGYPLKEYNENIAICYVLVFLNNNIIGFGKLVNDYQFNAIDKIEEELLEYKDDIANRQYIWVKEEYRNYGIGKQIIYELNKVFISNPLFDKNYIIVNINEDTNKLFKNGFYNQDKYKFITRFTRNKNGKNTFFSCYLFKK